MDRLEGLMALLIDDRIQFQQEHKQLLTAQVVLTDRLDRLAQTVKDLAAAQAESRKITDEKLNALIDIVDGLIRKPPPEPPV